MIIKRVILIAAMVVSGCTSATLFPPIGNHLGNPLMVAVNSVTSRLYVVNSNNLDVYNDGSVQVYNIATPAAPTLVGTATTNSFSGQIYLDTVNQFLYTPNRFNPVLAGSAGQLLQVNIDEASASFLSVGSTTAGSTPFGMTCCAPNGSSIVASLAGEIDAYALGAGAPALTVTNLSTVANDGTIYTNPAVNQVVILGTMAYLTMPANILVVNLSKLGGTANPVDYVITGILSPRDVATDGTNIFVTDVETINGVITPVLDILNPATLTAQVGNTQATNVAESTIQLAQLTMGNGTITTNPEQIVVGTNYVFVSCQGDNLVTVVNRVAQTVNTNIAVGTQPFGMALYSPAGVDTDLYVANEQSNTISIIDVGSLAVAATFAGP